MHFEISPGSSQLPLVTEIPSYEGIVRLEGLNGTGKSLTTEILALCVGRRLSSGEAWETLCEGLGTVTVKASDLVGADKIEWTFSGPALRDAAEDDPISWFDELRIDGESVQHFGQVGDLVS